MSEKVRAVMVGCGGITGGWLRAIASMDRVEMVGLVDLVEEAARSRASEFALPDPAIRRLR